MATRQEVKDELNNRPITGYPAGGTIGGAVLRDPKTGNAIGGYGLTYKAPDVNDPSARIGDYVLQNGKAVVVPNSVSDLKQKYAVISGGSEKPDSVSGSSAALSSLSKGVMGKVIGGTVAKAAAGSAAGPFGMILGATVGVLSAVTDYQNAQQEALKEWLNQEVNYTSAIEFKQNDDGKLIGKVDYSKMGEGDSNSGIKVKEAQDVETSVEIGDDGRLKVAVSPIFANTNLYEQITKNISENYGGLTKDSEDYDSSIETIKNYIDGYKNQYLYEMRECSVYKSAYAGASDESIRQGYSTQLAGYMSEENAEKFNVTVLRDGQKTEMKASDMLNHVYDMSKDERDSYIADLETQMENPDLTDDQKAIVLGEYSALWAASNNTNTYGEGDDKKQNKYTGMLNRDTAVSVMSSIQPMGIRMSNILNVVSFGNWFKSDQEHLKGNEAVETGIQALMAMPNLYASSKAMETIESGVRKIPLLKTVDQIAPQGSQVTNLKEAAVSFGFNAASDALFDAAKVGIETLGGRASNFGEDFAQDLMLDVIVTYGSTAQLDASLARRGVTNGGVEVNDTDIDNVLLKNDISIDSADLKGVDVEYKYADTNEIGSKLAKKLSSMEENATVTRIREALFDKNAALGTLAMKAYGETMDKSLYFKGVNADTNIRNLTKIETDKINSDHYIKGTQSAWRNLSEAVYNTHRNGHFSKAENNYMVASEELARYRQVFANDPQSLKTVEDAYRPYIEAVAPDTAAKLDNIVASLKSYLTKVGDSYVKSGVGDAESLAAMRDSDTFKEIGWVPLWGKYGKEVNFFQEAKTVSQTCKTQEDWTNINQLYKPENFESPINSSLRWANNIANNIAVNERNKIIVRLATRAGITVDNVVNDPKTKKAMDKAVKNFAQIKKKFTQTTNEVKERIRKQVPTQEEYYKTQASIIEKSGVEGAIEKFANRSSRSNGVRLLNDIQTKAAEAVRQAAKQNEKFGFSLDIEDYITNRLTPRLAEATKSMDQQSALTSAVTEALKEANPYISYEQVLSSAIDADATNFKNWLTDNIKISEDQQANKERIIDNTMARLSGDTTNGYDAGKSARVVTERNGSPVSYYVNGEKNTYFLRGPLAARLSSIANEPNTFVERGIFDRQLRNAANLKRLLTTGIDPTRALPNWYRDTARAWIASGGDFYLKPEQLIKDICSAEGFSKSEIDKIMGSLQLVRDRITGETMNNSLEVANKFRGKELARAAVEQNGTKAARYTWDVLHDKMGLLKKPMDFFEGLTRSRLVESAFARSLQETSGKHLSLDTRLKRATEEARFAGTELTTNFSRKGRMIEKMSQYVPYFAQNFSNIESFKYALVADPVGVGTKMADFATGYIFLLADALSNDDSRKNYYNLTEYDRNNNIVIAVDGGSIITIPLDESLAGFLYPYRRIVETLNGVDPASFAEIFFNGFLELSPFDLGGFSEGDTFNLQRGIERLANQALPTTATAAIQQMTGRDLYYGTDINIDDDYLLQYGSFAESAADYTTPSKNSALLGAVAAATGIPQWRLQALVAQFTGNVGQYVLNGLDKLSGATEEAQGGKEFFDATFKSFTGMDSQNAISQFYNGMNSLKEDKRKLQGELTKLNKQMETATGQDLVALKQKYQQKKDDFATKVNDFVSQYVSAFEITGGLSKNQAMQIYYLFRLDDDNSVYEAGSAADYYKSQAEQQASNEATSEGAAILDKYYNQTRNIYQDSDGTWKVYSPYGERAFFNTIYGAGTQHEVNLRNLIENGSTDLKSARTAMYAARNAAYAAGDWDAYDKAGYDYDIQVINTIAPYINRYGAENVLGNSDVLDYLEEWIIVPNNWMKTKYGKNVSLSHNASKQRAFVRPYIKYLFGLDTDYSSYNDDINRINRPAGSLDL